MLNKWQTLVLAGANWMRYVILAALVAFVMFGFTSCGKEKLEPNAEATTVDNFGIISNEPAKAFTAVDFRNSIANSLVGARGYAIVITRNGQVVDSASFGWAYSLPGGGGYARMNVNQEMHIASVSKTITAIAVIKLLKKNNLAVTAKIGEYLPAYWNARQAIKDLTFQELLTHSSGLAESSNSWDSLKTTVARGLDNPAKPAGVYANINYAIFRGIIPYLIDKDEAIQKDNSMSNATFENWLTNQYLDYVQDNIFSPIGLNSVTCTPSANTAMGYSECSGNNVCGLASFAPGDLRDAIGGVGFYMSAMELARFMVYLSHTYTLLSSTERSMMDNKMLGWDTGQSLMTEMGPSYGKNGLWFSEVNGTSGNNAGDPGMQSLVVKYPAGIELTLFVNSIPGPWRNLSSIARNAYNNAWDVIE